MEFYKEEEIFHSSDLSHSITQWPMLSDKQQAAITKNWDAFEEGRQEENSEQSALDAFSNYLLEEAQSRSTALESSRNGREQAFYVPPTPATSRKSSVVLESSPPLIQLTRRMSHPNLPLASTEESISTVHALHNMASVANFNNDWPQYLPSVDHIISQDSLNAALPISGKPIFLEALNLKKPNELKFIYENPESTDLKKRRNSSPTPSLFKCPFPDCTKVFGRFYNLRSHYRIHSGEKPFVCEMCETSFARNHDLKRHLKIHSGDRPFRCDTCQKTFSRNDAMMRHLKLNICVKKSEVYLDSISEERLR